jgi:hypothetical protein
MFVRNKGFPLKDVALLQLKLQLSLTPTVFTAHIRIQSVCLITWKGSELHQYCVRDKTFVSFLFTTVFETFPMDKHLAFAFETRAGRGVLHCRPVFNPVSNAWKKLSRLANRHTDLHQMDSFLLILVGNVPKTRIKSQIDFPPPHRQGIQTVTQCTEA